MLKIPKDSDLATLKGKFEETAPMYRVTKGLICKHYICDVDKSIGGGIYRFDHRENTDAWFNDDRIERLTNRFSKPEIEYFETLLSSIISQKKS